MPIPYQGIVLPLSLSGRKRDGALSVTFGPWPSAIRSGRGLAKAQAAGGELVVPRWAIPSLTWSPFGGLNTAQQFTKLLHRHNA